MGLSQTEWIARSLMKHYLPDVPVVYNVRPEWLINPETGNALEIDIFFPDLNIGFEISGVQRHRFTPGLQATYADYEKQLRHDTIKLRLCNERGITLYRFSIFELLENRFDPFIKDLMTKLGRLPQYEHIARPAALYASAKRLSSARVVSKTRPYRKPGLWPLLQRTWYQLRHS